jgi:hypothetical protein
VELFHFSERGDIACFEPRPVEVPAPRRPGQDWLNGPLVWAIDAWHQPMYLFPRECPRILLWPTETTSPEDRERWWGGSGARMIAHVERGWLGAFEQAKVFRYSLPAQSFECLADAGMWVSRRAVEPSEVTAVEDLAAALTAADVELRVVGSLAPLRAAYSSTLHVSGIRLRNSATWAQPV